MKINIHWNERSGSYADQCGVGALPVGLNTIKYLHFIVSDTRLVWANQKTIHQDRERKAYGEDYSLFPLFPLSLFLCIHLNIEYFHSLYFLDLLMCSTLPPSI